MPADKEENDTETSDIPTVLGTLERRRRASKGNGAAQGTEPRANTRSRQEFARLIRNACQKRAESTQKSVEATLKIGKYLIDARKQLKHGEFQKMVEDDLGFSSSKARMLAGIRRNPILKKREHVHVLPPSWGTLYELSKLPHNDLQAAIDDGKIHPELERAEASNLRNRDPNRKGKSVGQREIEQRSNRPRFEDARTAPNGDDWSQQDQVEEQGDSNAFAESLVDDIETILDPLRARIERAKQKSPAIRAMVLDALKEHVIATASRWVDDLSPSTKDGKSSKGGKR